MRRGLHTLDCANVNVNLTAILDDTINGTAD
jgi:hypothetical protein